MDIARLSKLDRKLTEINLQIENLQREKSELEAERKTILDYNDQQAYKKISEKDWEAKDFPWSKKVDEILASKFEMNSFRPLQLSVINATLSGHDVLVIMPTGGGKSLCYQLPALVAEKGFSIVISPLVSLMEDQMMTLQRLKIPSEMLHSKSSKGDIKRIMANMTDPNSAMRILYVTPEKLANNRHFMATLQKSYTMQLLNRMCIDEVHCCSHWGHDFRPDYKYLGISRVLFPTVPILGLTATSTNNVTEDVKKILKIGKKCLVFKSALNRPNLFYEVRMKPDSNESFNELLSELLSTEFNGQTGIIYARTIFEVENLTKDLKSMGHKVGCYHANLNSDDRSRVHKKWSNGGYQAVVATIAFGMGIDKPNVRFIIHHTMSKSMENYYQESGRAGRDDQHSKCILFYSFNDIFKLSSMVISENNGLEKLYTMVAYSLETTNCRRKLISDHFGEPWDSTNCVKMCDLCAKSNITAIPEFGLYECFEEILKTVASANKSAKRLTPAKVVDNIKAIVKSMMGSSGLKPSPGDVKFLGENIVATLILDGNLKQEFNFTPYKTISYVEPTGLKVSKGSKIKFDVARCTDEKRGTKRSLTTTAETSKKSKSAAGQFNFDDDL